MAERVGFEPTVEFPRHSLSRRALSTAQTPLRGRCTCSLTNAARGHNNRRGDSLMWFSEYSCLNARGRRAYNETMPVIGELGRKGVPRAISAEELRRTLGSSEAFCSWDASNSSVSDLTTRWPFVFSHPLLGTHKKPSQ